MLPAMLKALPDTRSCGFPADTYPVKESKSAPRGRGLGLGLGLEEVLVFDSKSEKMNRAVEAVKSVESVLEARAI